MRRDPRPVAWMAPLALALGVGLAIVDSRPPAGAASRTAPKPGAKSRLASGTGGRPMPDTVLARVSNGRLVTISGFHAAWRQVDPPGRPDSLTPASAGKFLELLVAKEALGEMALGEAWVWTDRESAEYRALRDGLTMKVVLDSALGALRARLAASGAAPGDAQALGVAARESLAVAKRVRFDTTEVGRLARAFAAVPRPSAESTLSAQLRILGMGPAVDAADLPRPVAMTREGAYTTGEVLAGWQALSPIYRPRIESREQVEDVIKNQIFERELRREVERRRIADWPPIAAALARKREYIAVSHLVAREVYARIATDSTTLHRYYAANRSYWDLPLRVALVRMVAPDRRGADAMGVQLADGARAESLLARGARAGVRYDLEITAESDSALFARAMRAGTGAVLGPDSTAGGWRMVRVRAVEPGRPRAFSECRMLVTQRWYGEEGERLMVELLDRCRRQARVEINEDALQRLTSP